LEINTPKLILYVLGIFFVALLGAVPPLLKNWNSRQLHLFIAFGAGVFLGAIFLHLLPDALSEGTETLASSMVLSGFLLILLIERIIFGSHKVHCDDLCGHRHAIVGMAAMIGLSAHSLTEGISLGLGMADEGVGFVIFLAIIGHKSIDAFSLATIFRLAEFSLKKTAGLILLLSLMTPVGALITIPFLGTMKEINLAVTAGLTAGTFLYVTTMDLLPEAFHSEKERASTFVWLILGIFIMFLIKIGGA